MIGMKLQEEDDSFINVLRPTLADTEGVLNLRKLFGDRIDFGRPKLQLAPNRATGELSRRLDLGHRR